MAHYFTSLPSTKKVPRFSSRNPAAVSQFSIDDEARVKSNANGNSCGLRRQAMAACFCLCCPIFRCAIWLCFLEFLCSGYIWFHMVDHLVKTADALQLHDVLLFIILSVWLITLSVAAVSICVAERKKRPDLIIPRIVQLFGLLILGFLLCVLLIAYFSGASTQIENTLIDLYEYIFTPSGGEKIDKESRREAHAAIRLYFIALIPIDFFWVCYEACALAIAWRYWRQMKRALRGTGYFQSVAVEPSPTVHLQNPHNPIRPPPFNPDYKASLT